VLTYSRMLWKIKISKRC